MATGSGKTFTAITAIYRLLKHSRVRRVLFLVDTRNLGEQAEQEFLAYTPNDDNRKFTELYTVARLNSSHVPADAEVCISTIQRMYSILQNRDLDESAEDENPAERSDPRREHDAWQQGIRILNPSHAELERGLALHRQLAVCENYGFLPKVRTTELEQSLSALMDRGLGWPEWKRKARVRRVTAAARDADGAREFFQLVEESGITCLIQSVNFMGESLDDTILILAAYRHLCNTFKDRLLQATCAEDIERAKAAGQTGLFFSLTGFPMAGAGGLADLDGLLDWVDAWYHLGVRFMHLGYNRRNAFADGCLEVNDDGLSDLGAALVRRMNATGVVVDIPHSSTRTTFDTAKVTTKPILASHVGCASVHRHRRCKTDEELKAIADTGGYVGIFSVPGFLGPRADLNTLLVHIQHALQVVGPDHVAVGTDVGYGQNWPEGLPAIPVRHGLNPLGKNPDPPMSPAPEPYPEGCGRVMPTPPLS